MLQGADSGNHTIRKITSAGVVTTRAGLAGNFGSADGTGSDARFQDPSKGVAVIGRECLCGRLWQITQSVRSPPADAVTTLAGLAGNFGSADGVGSDARFNQPIGVAVDSAGNVYVADSNNGPGDPHGNTIRKITPSGAS